MSDIVYTTLKDHRGEVDRGGSVERERGGAVGPGAEVVREWTQDRCRGWTRTHGTG